MVKKTPSESLLRRRARGLAKRTGHFLVCIRSSRWEPDFKRGEYMIKDAMGCVVSSNSFGAQEAFDFLSLEEAKRAAKLGAQAEAHVDEVYEAVNEDYLFDAAFELDAQGDEWPDAVYAAAHDKFLEVHGGHYFARIDELLAPHGLDCDAVTKAEKQLAAAGFSRADYLAAGPHPSLFLGKRF